MSTASGVVAVGEVRPIRPEDDPPQGLTSIRGRIHCGATPDTPEDGYSEADMIIVKNFLNTLADVALAVAIRNGEGQDDQA